MYRVSAWIQSRCALKLTPWLCSWLSIPSLPGSDALVKWNPAAALEASRLLSGPGETPEVETASGMPRCTLEQSALPHYIQGELLVREGRSPKGLAARLRWHHFFVFLWRQLCVCNIPCGAQSCRWIPRKLGLFLKGHIPAQVSSWGPFLCLHSGAFNLSIHSLCCILRVLTVLAKQRWGEMLSWEQ